MNVEFVLGGLITSYCLGWAFGAVILYFQKLMDVSTS